MPEYVHLHNHTHFSLLDGACTPKDLIDAALADEQRAIGLTDHGVMFGAWEFYKKAKAAGLKPVIGNEVYVANGTRFDKSAGKTGSKRKNYFHLVLLAKNEAGYRNLIKLTSLGHTEGYYYKPRIDRELLAKHNEGIIALSACLGGVVNNHIIENDMDAARETTQWFLDTYGDDFYLELQNHGLPHDSTVLKVVPQLAQEFNVKMVVTNDVHYLKKGHAVSHNVHLLIKDVTAATAGKVDINNLRYRVDEFYFKTQAEMNRLFADHPEAIENSVKIADQVELDLGGKLYMPNFPIPAESEAKTLDDYLEELTFKGLVQRYGELNEDIRERANFELNVINSMGYPGYFLIVWDFIKAARERGISVGPGRGSAAGSLVAYALEITNVDPIKYDLLFERFLNPDRVSMPDIDVDFSDDKREQVIEYTRQKYGAESVAQIITFGTLSTRAVLKDVGRVLGVPIPTVESITKNIPVTFGKVTPLAEALKLTELKWVQESKDPKIQELIKHALVLEGFCRNASLHAAGVVIAPGPVDEYVPLYKTPNSELATQYNMNDLEEAGLLKMDFLGLRTLSIIDKTLAMIERNHGKKIDIDEIDINDRKTYDLLGQGKTVAVFQFESEGMQKSLRMLKPSDLEDLTAMNALYRPGPMANIPEFIDRKHGRKEIAYVHPQMESSLKNTYGIIVYQEQVMQLVRDIAGFTLAQADILRRAMGKKKADLMEKMKMEFVDGAKARNIPEKIADEIYELIAKFASYGFNKSHALAYSYLAFQTAWLKTHYTSEFLAANMTAEMTSLEKIVQIIDEAKSLGIDVLPPDVNESTGEFTAIDDKTIRFGLAAIKNMGMGPVAGLMTAREQQKFESFFDFVARVDTKTINRRALEALVCAGAFDSLHPKQRARLFNSIDEALRYSQAVSASSDATTDSLFGDAQDSAASIKEPDLADVDEWNSTERLRREREYLNFYVSGHPLERYRPHVMSLASMRLGDAARSNGNGNGNGSGLNGGQVRVCGIITNIRTKLDKRDRSIAFVTIEDFSGKAECLFWSEAYANNRDKLEDSAIIMVVGRADQGGGEQLKVIAETVHPLDEAPDQWASGFKIKLARNKHTAEHIQRAYELFQSAERGAGEIYFSIYDENRQIDRRYRAQDFGVKPSTELATELMKIFGSRNVGFAV